MITMRDRKINFRSLTGKIHIAEINAFVKLVSGIFCSCFRNINWYVIKDHMVAIAFHSGTFRLSGPDILL